MSLKEINAEADVIELVNAFYKKVQKNELIGPIFNEVVNDHWEEHLPKMYRFWGSILLGSGEYKGNPMRKHVSLSQAYPLQNQHFDCWLELWNETIDEHFSGPKAEEAKVRAHSIAEIMRFKVGAK